MRLIGSLIVVVMVAGATTIDVVPSLGPNPWAGLPSFAAYTGNALTGLHNGTSGIGSGPSYYGIDYTFDFEDATVTNYLSWRGVADPDPPYDGEWGTSYFVGTHILDDDATFHPSDVRVWQFSTDVPIDPWHWGPFYLSASSLSGMRGYLDGVEVTPLAMDSVIDELVYVGIAGAYDASTYWGYSADQAGLDKAIADYRDAYGVNIVTTCYALGGTVNGTTSNGGITDCSEEPPVPEPATFVLGGAGLLGLLLLRRRR